MPAAPIRVKLRCKSWAQLRAIHERDLSRSALFLKASSPPALGTKVKVDLSLPSGSIIVLNGSVTEHVKPGGLGGRGPGVDIRLDTVPQSALWLIETALRSERSKAAAAGAADQANISDESDVVEAEEDLIEALEQEYESARRLNPFQLLDVPYEATDQQVRAAFGKLTRKYHPDRYARFQNKEARQYAGEVFILVRDAYRKLGTERGRKQTLALMHNKPVAATALATAHELVTAGQYDDAIRAFQAAARKDPNSRDARAGVELVEGLRALAVRDRLEAAQRFEAVLELDPTNERAARELAEMRRVATNERKGLLSRLLGKKE